MRILTFAMQGYAITQYVESDEEAERLFEEGRLAMAGYENFVHSAMRTRTHEVRVSDGSRHAIHLASLLSVTLATPDFPDWLRDHKIEMRRRDLDTEIAASVFGHVT